jgi:hypothetical protein
MNAFLDKLFGLGSRSTSSMQRRTEIEEAKDFGMETKNVPPSVLRKLLGERKKEQAMKDAFDKRLKDFAEDAVAKALNRKAEQQLPVADPKKEERPVVVDGKAELQPRPFGNDKNGLPIPIPIPPNLECPVPCPPASGEYVLVSVDGVMEWQEVTDC